MQQHLPKNVINLFIPGKIGKLECMKLMLLERFENIIGIAIVFHPDPSVGGNNSHKVVQTIAKAFNQLGYVVYCPNLRGVGQSDGSIDCFEGSQEDSLCVLNYIKNKHAELPLILAGFSFGAYIASFVATKTVYQKLILVGAAVSRYPIFITNATKTVLIHGQNDEIILLDVVIEFAKEHNLPITMFAATGHFFHGKLIQLHNYLVHNIKF